MVILHSFYHFYHYYHLCCHYYHFASLKYEMGVQRNDLMLLVVLVKVKFVTEHPVQADVDIDFIVEEHTGVLSHTSNY